jgi:mono/diheme cytochrome c family protein
MLDGIGGHDGLPGAMPSFRDKLGNDDLIAIAGYLRASYTTLPQWGLLEDQTTQAARNDPLSLR